MLIEVERPWSLDLIKQRYWSSLTLAKELRGLCQIKTKVSAQEESWSAVSRISGLCRLHYVKITSFSPNNKNRKQNTVVGEAAKEKIDLVKGS